MKVEDELTNKWLDFFTIKSLSNAFGNALPGRSSSQEHTLPLSSSSVEDLNIRRKNWMFITIFTDIEDEKIIIIFFRWKI